MVSPPLTLQKSGPCVTLWENWHCLTKDLCLPRDPGPSLMVTRPKMMEFSSSRTTDIFKSPLKHFYSLGLNCAQLNQLKYFPSSLCRSMLSLWAVWPCAFTIFILRTFFSSVHAVKYFGSTVLCVKYYINWRFFPIQLDGHLSPFFTWQNPLTKPLVSNSLYLIRETTTGKWPILNKPYPNRIKVQFPFAVFILNAERLHPEASWWHSIVALIYPGCLFGGIHHHCSPLLSTHWKSWTEQVF